MTHENTCFTADKVKINGPKVDGGFTVSFEVGEYEQQKLSQLIAVPQNTAIKVTVEAGE